MKNTYRSGLRAEWLARQFLRLHSFRIIESRYVTGRNTGRAEIDIIAKRKNLVLFIEVKNRPTPEQAIDAISFEQRRRLRAAAENWIRKNRWMGPARFDIIVVSGLRVRWFPNAV